MWTDATILSAYLPASGNAGVVTASVLDATTTSAGDFGGEVAALKLNVDLADAGILPETQR